jgi:hypothetical protein
MLAIADFGIILKLGHYVEMTVLITPHARKARRSG